MKSKFNKNGTIFYLLVKTYIELIGVIIISLIILILLITFFFSRLTENTLPNIGIYSKVDENYEKFDTNEIEALGGSLEVIDESRRVIYRKGIVENEKETFSEDELLKLSYISSVESSKKLHILNGFVSKNGQNYISIITLPLSSVKMNFQFSGKYIYLFKGIKSKVILTFSLFLLTIILSTAVLSYLISRKIGTPLRWLEKGLISIGEGDYKYRIEVSGPKEFNIVKDTFNNLLDKLNITEYENKQLAESKKRLLADLTHDIKSPITSIKGFSQALVDGRISDECKDKYYKVINRKSDEVVLMVEELFQYVKMDSTDFKLNIQRKDICEVLRRLIVKYYDDIENKGMKLEYFIPDEKNYIQIDEVNLLRALGNLVDNALKYNKSGARIKLELLNKEIEKIIVIRVCDNGTGIKNKKIVFDPFVREDESRKNDGGTGLGLSIVKKIIELHEGNIYITENEEFKTIFEIVLKA